MMHHSKYKRHAFSLVELSIVLVILGLLVGGVLSGQALIRAAQLRAVSIEYTKYFTAATTFRDKYFAMPGDMNNATSFWKRMNNTVDCVTNSGAAVDATTGVCDGNGSGQIIAPSGASLPGEIAQFWRQLSKAGLIEGEYSGVVGTLSANDCAFGTDCPASRLSSTGWRITRMGVIGAGDPNYYSMDYGHMLYLTAKDAGGAAVAILTPAEAWNIDTKIDDGKPARGRMIARWWNNVCSAPDDGATFTNTNLAASYKVSDTSLRCAVYFRSIFE